MSDTLTEEQRIRLALEAADLKTTEPLLAFQPLPATAHVLESGCKIIILFGGNRSGKSDFGGYWLVRQLTKRLKAWCVTVDQPLSIRVQQAKIHKFVPKRQRTKATSSKQHLYYSYTPEGGYSNEKFTLINGASCEFKTYRQAVVSFQGDDLDVIWFDELPPLPIFLEAQKRLWDRGGTILVTATSVEGVTPFVREILASATTKATRYAGLAKRELPTYQQNKAFGCDIHYLWTTDNPYIDQEQIERDAAKMPQSEIELRIYGIPSNLAGVVYPNFSTVHHQRKLPIPTSSPSRYVPLMALDPHDRKPWCMGWYALYRNALYVLAEWPDTVLKGEERGAEYSYSDYVRIIKLKETELLWTPRTFIHRIIDPNKGNSPVVGEQRTETIKMTLSRPPYNLYFTDNVSDDLAEGHAAVREWLAYNPMEPVSETNQPRLFIDPRCQNHIIGMQNYEFKDHVSDRQTQEEAPKEQLKSKFKDFPDLIRYTIKHLQKAFPESNVSGEEVSLPKMIKPRRRSYA